MILKTNCKGVCKFIGLFNYYTDVWAGCSHVLELITALMYSEVKFNCAGDKQKVLKEIKWVFACNT